MKKADISGKIFIVVFFILLVLPMLFTDFKSGVASDMDNKTLAEFPGFGEESFNTDLEQYFEDRVGFRSAAITMYQYLCSTLFHVLVHPAYTYGKGDEIYSLVDLTTYQNLDVSDEYINCVSDYLARLTDLCEKNDAKLFFFLCPNKESVYFEDFPRGYNIKDQENRSDRLIEAVSSKGIDYVYPRGSYRSMKGGDLLYNRKYDVLHWNQRGCFYGMKELTDKEIGAGFAVKELSEEEFEITDKTEKYLHQSYFIINDVVPDYKLLKDNVIDDSEAFFRDYEYTNKNQYHYHYINPEEKDAPKVLAIGDSYFGNPLVYDSLKTRSSELMIVHICNMGHMKDYMTRFKPDVVVVEAVERVLGENEYWSEDNIKEWDQNLR